MSETVTVALMGDVMLGRGVDQALPEPRAPWPIFESSVKDARYYSVLSGIDPRHEFIPDPWGDVLSYLQEKRPTVTLLNLETALTARVPGTPWPKGINYRAHPSRVEFLQELPTQVIVNLANNHILDWGKQGLDDTLHALDQANIRHVGAGQTIQEAQRPVILINNNNNSNKKMPLVAVWGACDVSSGVPASWGATPSSPGVWLLSSTSQSPFQAAQQILQTTLPYFEKEKQVIKALTLHYGPNWASFHSGPDAWAREFSHFLIDQGFDLIHMHSSHHVRSMELYKGKLILYGSGDLINDYEGISGHEEYNPEDRLIVSATFETQGKIVELEEAWFQPRGIQLELQQVSVLSL